MARVPLDTSAGQRLRSEHTSHSPPDRISGEKPSANSEDFSKNLFRHLDRAATQAVLARRKAKWWLAIRSTQVRASTHGATASHQFLHLIWYEILIDDCGKTCQNPRKTGQGAGPTALNRTRRAR